MKRTSILLLVAAGGLTSAVFGQQNSQQYPRQQYPQQNAPYQGDQNYNGQNGQYSQGQYDNGQYQNGQYQGNSGNGGYDQGQEYDDNQEGIYAPEPPPMPRYAYQRSVMPGAGYSWVDGYWNFTRGRYVWVGGYWTLPPYVGVSWVAPRYAGGRFFLGFWGRGGSGYSGRNDYRYGNIYRGDNYGYQGRPIYSAPVHSGAWFRNGGAVRDYRGWQGREHYGFRR